MTHRENGIRSLDRHMRCAVVSPSSCAGCGCLCRWRDNRVACCNTPFGCSFVSTVPNRATRVQQATGLPPALGGLTGPRFPPADLASGWHRLRLALTFDPPQGLAQPKRYYLLMCRLTSQQYAKIDAVVQSLPPSRRHAFLVMLAGKINLDARVNRNRTLSATVLSMLIDAADGIELILGLTTASRRHYAKASVG